MEMDERAMISYLSENLHFIMPAIGGVVLGITYFQSVRRSADLIVSGRSTGLVLLLTIGRLGLLAGALFWALQFGALPLLLVTLGIVAGRHWVVLHTRRVQNS